MGVRGTIDIVVLARAWAADPRRWIWLLEDEIDPDGRKLPLEGAAYVLALWLLEVSPREVRGHLVEAYRAAYAAAHGGSPEDAPTPTDRDLIPYVRRLCHDLFGGPAKG
jgi:hypothetical protein